MNPVFSKLFHAYSAVPCPSTPTFPIPWLLPINPSHHTLALSSVCCFLRGPQISEA